MAFLSAAIIPIPALRCFALQTAILISIISFAVIILFPALVSMDLRLRSQYMSRNTHSTLPTPFNPINDVCYYFFCGSARVSSSASPCSEQQSSTTPSFVNSSQTKSFVEQTSSCLQQPYLHKQPYNCYYLNSIRSTNETNPEKKRKTNDMNICSCDGGSKLINNWNGDDTGDEMYKLMQRSCEKCGGELRTQCDGKDDDDVFREGGDDIECSDTVVLDEQTSTPKTMISEKCRSFKFSTKYLISNFYAPFLQRKPVKALALLSFLVLIVVSMFGIIHVNDGLDLTDIVPRNTMEHQFLNYQQKYFSFFNIFAVTKGNFDYPNNQRLLYEYHQSFTRVGAIVKNDDGGLPEFWLSSFRDWLTGLQNAFDEDWKQGRIRRENWFANASQDGIFAYKLLVQTGRVDNPVDKSLVSVL